MLLDRFADAHLQARLDGCLRRLADATQLVRRQDALLKQARAEARTNYDLAQRWKSIAQRQAALVEELRAEHRKEPTP